VFIGYSFQEFVKIELSTNFTLNYSKHYTHFTMNYTIQKKDHYSLIIPDLTQMQQESCEMLRKKVLHEVASSSKYVIVNISSVKDCTADGVRELIKLGLELQQHGGMLIITYAEDSFTRLFNKADITFIPTDTEAVDFVFMDHLEKQFMQEN
jgi:anti-anti-sigma regulatory factor